MNSVRSALNNWKANLANEWMAHMTSEDIEPEPVVKLLDLIKEVIGESVFALKSGQEGS
jgi:hypothetical protein